jgi:hypothetical protein
LHQWPVVRIPGFTATVLLALAFLFAVPTASAGKPTRTLFSPEGFVAPPGELCSFGVRVQPDADAQVAVTEFESGRFHSVDRADATITNLANGASIVTKSRFLDTQTYDAAANDLLLDTHGRVNWFLAAGDQGAFGVIGEDGAMFTIVGHSTAIVDLDTDTVSSFRWSGEYTDLCALLAA